MLKENEIKTGDIGVIVKPQTFLGRIIGIFTHNKSHSFNFARIDNILYVFEMEGEGCIKTRYKDSDYISSENWVLMRPNIEYTNPEAYKFAKMCEQIYNIHAHYDLFALFRHLSFELSGRYPLETKNNKKYICSEYCALCANNAKAYTFGNEQTITPEAIFKSKFYTKISK